MYNSTYRVVVSVDISEKAREQAIARVEVLSHIYT